MLDMQDADRRKKTFIAYDHRTNRFRYILYFIAACAFCLYASLRHPEPKEMIIKEKDPLKYPITRDCPKNYSAAGKFSYPPPNPNPMLDIHSTYPSSAIHPPLIGDMSVVVQYDYEIGNYVGSPSVLKLPDGTWISSFDVKILSHTASAKSWETQIWTSSDQGLHWTYKTSIKGLSWGSLFTVNNEVYVLGAGMRNTRIMISKMNQLDNWSKAKTIVNKFEHIHTGNVGVLVAGDKVQTCIKNGRSNNVIIIYAYYKQDDLMQLWRTSNIALDKLNTESAIFAFDLMNILGAVAEEGVMVPYGPKHAQVIMRVNNDEICGLSERYLWNLETNELSFWKFSIDPGWATAHGFVIYDPVSDFYWMVSNYPRDNSRNIKKTSIYVPLTGRCAMDRSILGLYYNKHLSESWHLAGFVSYSPDFAHHASYPFLVQDGDDLVFVARAHLGGPYNETTVNHGKRVCAPYGFKASDATANNHNSNMVIFSRIKNFRQYIHPMMWYGQRDDNPWESL